MNKKRAKSPCCGAGVSRHGGKRRQCDSCGKTWTIRPKQQGRKRRRLDVASVIKYLNHERIPLIRERNHLSCAARSARLRLERDDFLRRRKWHPIPAGPLVIVADAIVRYAAEGWHTWFFVLARAVNSDNAVILPPQHQAGTETAPAWQKVIAALPDSVLSRTIALVSDGHKGLTSEALWRHWHIQRCHFHLMARLQSRRSRWKTSRHFEEGKRIYELVKRILTESDDSILPPIINELETFGWVSKSPEIRRTLSGFVSNYKQYRTYLDRPELNLPTTNNSVETLNALVKSFCERTRGFRTVKSLHAWITALCKARGSIKCRRGKTKENTELIC